MNVQAKNEAAEAKADVDDFDKSVADNFNDIFGDQVEEPDEPEALDMGQEAEVDDDADAEPAPTEGKEDDAAEAEKGAPEEAEAAEEPEPDAVKDAEEAQPAEPEAEKPAQPQEPKPAPKAVEQPKPPTQEEINQQYAQWRQNAERALVDYYQLTDDQAELLQTEPEKALPVLASRLHMEVMQAALTQTARMIPGMIQQVLSTNSSRQSAEDKFFQKWPDLKGHEDVIRQFGMAYRQINPQGTEDDFINTVGVQASVHLKKPIPGYGQQAAPQTSAKPAVRQAPPKPAAAAGGPGLAVKVTPDEAFAGGIFESDYLAVDDDDG